MKKTILILGGGRSVGLAIARIAEAQGLTVFQAASVLTNANNSFGVSPPPDPLSEISENIKILTKNAKKPKDEHPFAKFINNKRTF